MRSSVRRGPNHPGTSGLEWHLDPIDGTVNFVYDLPTWCTSVGVVDDAGGVAGAVYVPVLDEMFSAARGEGATLNGDPIVVSGRASLDMALVGTGFSYLPERRRTQSNRVAAMLPEIRDIRRFGSAAIDLCLVACGRLDAYFEQYLNSWDTAAGVLIAEEAGATTSGFGDGRPSYDGLVVAAPGIHAALLALDRALHADGLIRTFVGRARRSPSGSGIMGVWVHASWPSKTTSASAQR